MTKPRTITLPKLAKGERYVGLMLDEKGKPSHHLVLLPGQANDVTWKAAGAWAKKQGGTLPTRKEQALLFANAGSEFEARAYWSAEQYAGNDCYAWCQGFTYGNQDANLKNYSLRARAVRKVAV